MGDTIFSEEFYSKILNDPLRRNIEYSIRTGANPYRIIEDLCNSIDSYREDLTAYIDGRKPTPIIVPYDSLPDDLKSKISK